ncbi:hypothetical protein AB0K48_53135, partial [Nonomuraea sp. NPDC055795]
APADCVTINSREAASLNQLAEYANSKQAQMAAALPGVKIAHASPVSAFDNHGACAADEWINAAVNGPNGKGDFHNGDPATPFCLLWGAFCLSRESFHPKAAGTTAYATAATNTLTAIGYKGS